MHNPSVVVIGGGTGTYTILSALRDKPVNLTALLTMVDDGGSNKVLRDEFGLLPTSGVRLAMVALSTNRTLLRELFLYRFHQGNGIAGMTFGNLFLAAVSDIVGSQQKAIEETSKLLSVKGAILPISYDDVQLVATYEDGSEVIGEHHIDEPEHDGRMQIASLRTNPKATISTQAKEAIENAEYILLGPGDFYTNTIANLVVDGVGEAIAKSKGKVIFVVNLMTKYGETYDFTAKTFIDKLTQFIPADKLSCVVMNNDTAYPPEVLSSYEKEYSTPVLDDLDGAHLPPTTKIVRAAILSHEAAQKEKGDSVKRSIIRHDQEKLGDVVFDLLMQRT